MTTGPGRAYPKRQGARAVRGVTAAHLYGGTKEAKEVAHAGFFRMVRLVRTLLTRSICP